MGNDQVVIRRRLVREDPQAHPAPVGAAMHAMEVVTPSRLLSTELAARTVLYAVFTATSLECLVGCYEAAVAAATHIRVRGRFTCSACRIQALRADDDAPWLVEIVIGGRTVDCFAVRGGAECKFSRTRANILLEGEAEEGVEGFQWETVSEFLELYDVVTSTIRAGALQRDLVTQMTKVLYSLEQTLFAVNVPTSQVDSIFGRIGGSETDHTVFCTGVCVLGEQDMTGL